MRPYERGLAPHNPVTWDDVRDLIDRHPLPWRVEEDWTYELLDARGQLVKQFMSGAEALEWERVANRGHL